MAEDELVDGFKSQFLSDYAQMLGEFNTSIAKSVQRATDLLKSPVLTLIHGGKSDLFKASGAPKAKEPKVKAPKVTVPKTKSAQEKKDHNKIKNPGSKGGIFYKDDKGNVRYGTKPTPKFHTPVTEEEHQQLHTNLLAVINNMADSNIKSISKHANVQEEVLFSLQKITRQAIALDMDPHELFLNKYLSEFPDRDPDEVSKEGDEVFSNTLQTFKELAESDVWKKKAEAALAAKQIEGARIAQAVETQKPLLENTFKDLVSGDLGEETIKSLAIMHSLEFLNIPGNLQEALLYADDVGQAKSLIGQVRLNIERTNNVLMYGDSLAPSQQVALVNAVMLNTFQAAKDDEPETDINQFFDGLDEHPVYDQLREWLEQDKPLSDAEFALVKSRVKDMAKGTASTITDYNIGQGGQIFKALHHNITDVAKVYKNKGELQRIVQVEAEVKQRASEAVDLQDSDDCEVDPEIDEAMRKNVGPDASMFKFQKAAVNWMMKIKSGVLAFDAGLGKAQRDDTPTLTPSGYKRLDSIKPGDRVIGADGKPVPVIAVFPKGVKKNYRVTFSDGSHTNACDEHLWHVFSTSQKRRGQHEVIDTKEMLRRGLTSPNGRARFMIPIVKPVEFEHKDYVIPPYTMGVMLGDGNFEPTGSVRITNERQEVRERIREESHVGINVNGSSTRDNCFSFVMSSGGRLKGGNPYVEAIKDMGLQSVRSNKKFIPKAYRYGSVEQRIALLQGLCDTDGYITKSGTAMQFYSTSKRLRNQFIGLVQSLGGLASKSCKKNPQFTYKGEQRTGQDCYIASFNLPREIQPFTRGDRAERYAERNNRRPWGLARTIVDIKRVEDAPSRCIKIANPDGLYITNSYIVTHNTPIAIAALSMLMKKGAVKRGVLVLPANLVAQWPDEIQKFRPGSKVQVISQATGSLDDRLLKLKAINEGKLEADFVIISAGSLEFTDTTHESLKEDVQAFSTKAGKKKVSTLDTTRLAKQNKHVENDPFVQELKRLEGCFVYDEAHSDGQGLKGNTVRSLIANEVLKDREYKFGMTATPMTKGPENLYTLMNMFHPGSAGESVSSFKNKMVKYKKTIDPITGKDTWESVDRDTKELRDAKKSLKPYCFFLRKSSDRVVKEMGAKNMKLPDLNPVSHSLKLEGEAKDMYAKASVEGIDSKYEPYGGFPKDYITDKDMRASLVKRGVSDRSINTAMRQRQFMRKQMAAISPKLLDKNYKGAQPKIDTTIDLIQRHFSDPANADKPVVIFGSYINSLTLMRDELQKAGIPPHLTGTITGEQSLDERSAVQEAVNQGKCKVVFIGIQAGGAGLNLQKKAYRNIFLDKPWTPAEMEQAVGRTWRTGAKADSVHVHHMKVVGTTDELKYNKMNKRTALNDSLAFADMPEEALSQMVGASMARLSGSFDADAVEQSDEDRKALLKMSGLSPDSPLPFSSIKAFKEHFNLKELRKSVAFQKFKESGHLRIQEYQTINDLKYANKKISKKDFIKQRKKIHRLSKKFLQINDIIGEHPVAEFAGHDFVYGTEATNSVSSTTAREKPAGRKTPKKNKRLEKQAGRLPVEAFKEKKAKKVKKSITLQSDIKVLCKSNPCEVTSAMWPFAEAIIRLKPTSGEDAVRKVSTWVSGNLLSEQQAFDTVSKAFEDNDVLRKLHEQGIFKVAP